MKFKNRPGRFWDTRKAVYHVKIKVEDSNFIMYHRKPVERKALFIYESWTWLWDLINHNWYIEFYSKSAKIYLPSAHCNIYAFDYKISCWNKTIPQFVYHLRPCWFIIVARCEHLATHDWIVSETWMHKYYYVYLFGWTKKNETE